MNWWSLLGLVSAWIWMPVAIAAKRWERLAKRYVAEAQAEHEQAHAWYQRAHELAVLVSHEIDFARRGPEL